MWCASYFHVGVHAWGTRKCLWDPIVSTISVPIHSLGRWTICWFIQEKDSMWATCRAHIWVSWRVLDCGPIWSDFYLDGSTCFDNPDGWKCHYQLPSTPSFVGMVDRWWSLSRHHLLLSFGVPAIWGGGGMSFDKGWWHVAAFEWWIRMPRCSFFVSLRSRNSSMPFLSFLFAYSTCLVTKALTRSSCYWDSSLHDAIRFFK